MAYSAATPSQFKKAQEIARRAADRYFAALAETIPSFDSAPGDVNLTAAVCDAQSALLAGRDQTDENREDAALRAGWVVGFEFGRRMREVRS